MPSITPYFFILPFAVVEGGALLLSWRFALFGENPITPTRSEDWLSLVVAIIAVAVVYLVLRRWIPRGASMLIRIFFHIALFVSFAIIINAFTMSPTLIVLGAGGLLGAYLGIRFIWMHDLLILASFAAVASVIGLSFEPLQIVFILTALSVYDFIAVFVTGHMQVMAKEFVGYGVIPAFIVPPSLHAALAGRREASSEEGRHMILGGGDLALPAGLVASSVGLSMAHAVVVGVFVLLGAYATYRLFVRGERGPLPALPSLSLAAVVGYIMSILWLS